ncbi:helix-turn-helix domain-containing protein [Rhizobium rhizoryzae]|uniref:CRP-like cAMP-binding protein n=1 Tax=Rhizobium rhizoryzae TaxID=451876 RepID=A0A7W6LJN1_9HYPH|nr:helix-turn-helix domain-containing protein [Rhizobium rhizoryzae]MBB4145599.1 CRP-like cAMP-binding protein [Rhizobium rhizoryzae]
MLSMLSRDEAFPLHVLRQFSQASIPRIRNFSAHIDIPLARLGVPLTFRLLRGCVVLYRELSDERRQILDIFGPGWVISGEHVDLHECRAMAVCDPRLEEIETEQNAEAINEAAMRMLKRAQAHGLVLGRQTATERVASALLDLSGQFTRQGHDGRSSFLLYLSRSELADWLGLTHETVSRCLSRFKRDRLIAFDQPELITIRDRQGLLALATGATPAA